MRKDKALNLDITSIKTYMKLSTIENELSL